MMKLLRALWRDARDPWTWVGPMGVTLTGAVIYYLTGSTKVAIVAVIMSTFSQAVDRLSYIVRESKNPPRDLI